MKTIEIALKTGEVYHTDIKEASDMEKGMQIIIRSQAMGHSEVVDKYFIPWENIRWIKENIS